MLHVDGTLDAEEQAMANSVNVESPSYGGENDSGDLLKIPVPKGMARQRSKSQDKADIVSQNEADIELTVEKNGFTMEEFL